MILARSVISSNVSLRGGVGTGAFFIVLSNPRKNSMLLQAVLFLVLAGASRRVELNSFAYSWTVLLPCVIVWSLVIVFASWSTPRWRALKSSMNSLKGGGSLLSYLLMYHVLASPSR